MGMPRYAAKRDKNEGEIVAMLRGVGASVILLDEIDVLCGFRGVNYLIEIKVPKQGRLTPSQKKLREDWAGQYAIVKTPEEALRTIGAIS